MKIVNSFLDRADKFALSKLGYGRKMNLKKIRVCVIVVFVIAVIVVAFKVKDHYENRIWYEFADDMKKEYPIIQSVKKSDFGPETAIWIFVKEEDISIKAAEEILGSVLKNINDKEFLEHIKTYHNQHASGEFTFVSVIFHYKNDKSDVMYEFKSIAKEKPYYSRLGLYWGVHEECYGREYDLSDYK